MRAPALAALSAALIGACAPGFDYHPTNAHYPARAEDCCFSVVSMPPAGAPVTYAATRPDRHCPFTDVEPIDEAAHEVGLATVETRSAARPFARNVEDLRSLLGRRVCELGGDLLVGQLGPDGGFVGARIVLRVPAAPAMGK